MKVKKKNPEQKKRFGQIMLCFFTILFVLGLIIGGIYVWRMACLLCDFTKTSEMSSATEILSSPNNAWSATSQLLTICGAFGGCSTGYEVFLMPNTLLGHFRKERVFLADPLWIVTKITWIDNTHLKIDNIKTKNWSSEDAAFEVACLQGSKVKVTCLHAPPKSLSPDGMPVGPAVKDSRPDCYQIPSGNDWEKMCKNPRPADYK